MPSKKLYLLHRVKPLGGRNPGYAIHSTNEEQAKIVIPKLEKAGMAVVATARTPQDAIELRKMFKLLDKKDAA
tara:strand:+ start:1986 stop:2204 length:219 start_codon:yes stop_codon:yes gene_type:complete